MIESHPRDRHKTRHLASKVFPQLIVENIDTDESATLIHLQGPLGGPTYEGVYPQGNRLLAIEDYPHPDRVRLERVIFDLDEQGRLVRIRHSETSHVTEFNLADEFTSQISIAKSFGDGGWMLEESQIYPNLRPELFELTRVIALARTLAFETADARRTEQSERAATPIGKKQMEDLRDDFLSTGLNQSTKRFALILTGLIVIAVGSLAWWKNRS